jgi:hypothetical protein
MSLRMPQSLAGARAGEAAFTLLDGELFAEKATNLGRLGRAVEAALSELAAAPDAASERREALLQAASATVWRYFVQREMCGASDHRDAIALYAIPREVLNRLGSVR